MLDSCKHYINVNNVICIQIAPLYLIFMKNIKAIDKGPGGGGVIINVYMMLTRTQKDCPMYFLYVECKYL